MIEKKIICMHGGIGRSINTVEQIEKLERPITMDVGSIILMDLLWYLVTLLLCSSRFSIAWLRTLFFLCKCRSDPTENDSVEGLRPNARGPGLVTFGVLHDYSVAVEFLMFAFSYYYIKCLPCQIKYYVGSSFLNNQSYRWLCWSNLFPVKFSAWSSNRVL